MGDDYFFLQEKIKDEAGNPKTIKKRVIRMIVFGLVFGFAACLGFCVLKPVMAEILGQDKEEISIPEDEISEDEVSETQNDGTDNAVILAEEQQQMKLLKEVQNAAKTILPAMVHISGQKEIEKDTEIMATSGIIIADNGSEILVLSQTLSEKELKNVRVTFADAQDYPAKVKMKDNNIGIVVCAVDKESVNKETLKQMKIATLGNSLRAESGDPVILAGKPDVDDVRVSYGFIASSEEKIEFADGYVNLLRADVAGAVFDNGMLFNQSGEMLGLINASASDNKTLVTVYSISDIKKELEHISNGKGVPYIGVWGVALPEELKTKELNEGVWVKEIETDSPAMEAGIQPGDIITEIGEEKIATMQDYRDILLKNNVKDTLVLSGLRKGADDSYVEMEFKVIVGKK